VEDVDLVGGRKRAAALQATEGFSWPRLAGGRYPGLPYVVLSLVLLVSSACGAIFTLLPADNMALAYNVMATLVFLVAAILVWFLGPRLPGGWGLDLGLAVPGVVLVAAAAIAMSPQAQVLVGLATILFGVVAAYFRPLWRSALLVGLLLLTYGGALLLNPQLNVVYYAIIAVFTIAICGVVAVLVSQLREQAVTDGLTGVLNRRGLLALSSLVQADLQRGHGPVSLALIDIDGFKEYNDRLGHMAGDELLKGLARGITSGLRTSDIIARYGGDEFVVILRGVDVDDAEAALSRVAEAFTAARWSTGVTEWEAGETLDDALAEADRRLYAAKHAR
jgi:diguanylate cyclase (GGDEF)-like protein